MTTTWETVVYMVATDDVPSGDYFCVLFSNRVCWVGSGIELY